MRTASLHGLKSKQPQPTGPCLFLQSFLTLGMIAHFHYAASRGGEVIPQIIGPDYQGCLMCDGHSAYQQSRLPNGFLGACLIHVMRKFKELVKIGKGAKALEHSKAAKAVEKLGESLSHRGWSKLYNSGPKSSGTKAKSQTVVRWILRILRIHQQDKETN